MTRIESHNRNGEVQSVVECDTSIRKFLRWKDVLEEIETTLEAGGTIIIKRTGA